MICLRSLMYAPGRQFGIQTGNGIVVLVLDRCTRVSKFTLESRGRRLPNAVPSIAVEQTAHENLSMEAVNGLAAKAYALPVAAAEGSMVRGDATGDPLPRTLNQVGGRQHAALLSTICLSFVDSGSRLLVLCCPSRDFSYAR